MRPGYHHYSRTPRPPLTHATVLLGRDFKQPRRVLIREGGGAHAQLGLRLTLDLLPPEADNEGRQHTISQTAHTSRPAAHHSRTWRWSCPSPLSRSKRNDRTPAGQRLMHSPHKIHAVDVTRCPCRA